MGSDQFVYWRASDPKICLAPDAFLKLGQPFEHFDSWKTWERGAPDLAVEIVSESDRSEWDSKLERYRDLGVRKLLRFDPDGQAGQRLRVWDRVEGDLVERALEEECAESFVLTLEGAPVYWIAAQVEGVTGLRLSRDPAGAAPILSTEEARQAAEARVRQLEEQLARRSR